MSLLIMKNDIAYRDQVNHETKTNFQTNVMPSPLPWSTFFLKTVSGKKIRECTARVHAVYVPQPHRKLFKGSFSQNYDLTRKHPHVPGRIDSMPHSLTASGVRVEDKPAVALRKQDQSDATLLRGLPG